MCRGTRWKGGQGGGRSVSHERGRRPRNKEGRKAAVAAWQGKQRQPRGEEGSGGRAARKAAAAARRGRQWRPRGKEGSGGRAARKAAAAT
jgi:hypothetical protein